LFFHRGLRCLVAIDLKLGLHRRRQRADGPLPAWLKEHEWREEENEPSVLILCSSKKSSMWSFFFAMAHIKMQVSEY